MTSWCSTVSLQLIHALRGVEKSSYDIFLVSQQLQRVQNFRSFSVRGLVNRVVSFGDGVKALMTHLGTLKTTVLSWDQETGCFKYRDHCLSFWRVWSVIAAVQGFILL